eukprot:1214811-Pleurochrysis_carterae.AAC.1
MNTRKSTFVNGALLKNGEELQTTLKQSYRASNRSCAHQGETADVQSRSLAGHLPRASPSSQMIDLDRLLGVAEPASGPPPHLHEERRGSPCLQFRRQRLLLADVSRQARSASHRDAQSCTAVRCRSSTFLPCAARRAVG